MLCGFGNPVTPEYRATSECMHACNRATSISKQEKGGKFPCFSSVMPFHLMNKVYDFYVPYYIANTVNPQNFIHFILFTIFYFQLSFGPENSLRYRCFVLCYIFSSFLVSLFPLPTKIKRQ